MLQSLARQQTLEQNQQDGFQNPLKQLKAIITRENKIRDPFRVKKGVTFMISLNNSGSEPEIESDEEDNAEREE